MTDIFGNPLFERVLGLIKSWQPERKYDKETDYRDDLMRYLRGKLNEEQRSMFGFGPTEKHVIQTESSRALADIGIDRIIGIELKLNLDKKKERNRLFGQIKDYMKGYRYIIIVLCGQTSESEFEQLFNDFKGYSEYPSLLENPRAVVRIIKKDKTVDRGRQRGSNPLWGFG